MSNLWDGTRWQDYTMHPFGWKNWLKWFGQALRLKKCWDCKWSWIWRRDIYFDNDEECHACWLWSK